MEEGRDAFLIASCAKAEICTTVFFGEVPGSRYPRALAAWILDLG
jgi:hypothetical protein